MNSCEDRGAGNRIDISWEGVLDGNVIAACRPVAARALSAAQQPARSPSGLARLVGRLLLRPAASIEA